MKVKIENGQLIVAIPLDKEPRLSSTGKNLTVASTRGNRTTDLEIQGRPVTVSVNAYIPPAA